MMTRIAVMCDLGRSAPVTGYPLGTRPFNQRRRMTFLVFPQLPQASVTRSKSEVVSNAMVTRLACASRIAIDFAIQASQMDRGRRFVM